jgi:hypothetical protein
MLMPTENVNPVQIEAASRMRFYLSLYLFVAGFYLLTASGRIGLSDSVAMLNVAQSIINEGSFSSEPCEYDVHVPSAGSSIGCIPGTGGRHYAGYGLVPSLLVVPAILCARSVAAIVHINPLVISKTAVSIFTLLVAPLVCVVLAAWILKLGYNRRTAAAGAGILAFASPFWHNSVKGFLSEPYFTLALLVAAYLLSSPRRKFACALAGLAFGVACGARLTGVILLPAFILSMAFYIRAHKLSMAHFLRDSVYFSASFSLCALLIALANYARFGSPFKTGYHLSSPSISILLSTPLFRGVFEVLFNGEVGLLVFAPWVLLALICFPHFVRAHRPESVLCGTSFLIYLLFFSKYFDWHGGWVAGPRYLIPTLPFLVMAMVPAIQYLDQTAVLKQRRWVVVGPLMVLLVGAGFLIQAVGTAFPEDRYYALKEFYEHKSANPWWLGSIPLASIDFLSRMTTARAQSAGSVESVVSDRPSVDRAERSAFASISTATSEEDFLHSFPNAENLTLPNLMLVKMKVLGLPAVALYGLLISVVIAGSAGLIGLKRCTARV